MCGSSSIAEKKRRAGLLFLRRAASGGESGPGLLRKRREGGLVEHGQVGQHLAVHFHFGFLQAVHEGAVGQAQLTRGGVDTGDPQDTELTLALTTVAVGVLSGLHHRLFGDAVYVLATATVALGEGEDLLVTGAGGYTTFNSGHGVLLSSVRKHCADQLGVGVMNSRHAAQLALVLGGLLGQDVTLEGLRPLDPATGADLEPLGGTALGFHLGHCCNSCYWMPPGSPQGRLRPGTTCRPAVSGRRFPPQVMRDGKSCRDQLGLRGAITMII